MEILTQEPGRREVADKRCDELGKWQSMSGPKSFRFSSMTANKGP